MLSVSYAGKNAYSAGKTSGVLRSGASGANRCYVLAHCAPRTSFPLPPPIEASRLKNWFVWLFWLAGPFWSTQLVCKAVPSRRSLKLVHLAVTPKCGGQTALDISSFAVFFLWVPEQVGRWILVFKIKNKDDLNMKTTKKMTQKIKVISK